MINNKMGPFIFFSLWQRDQIVSSFSLAENQTPFILSSKYYRKGEASSVQHGASFFLSVRGDLCHKVISIASY